MRFSAHSGIYIATCFSKSPETDLDDELRNYVDTLIARKTAAGMSADEARRSALAEVGGIEQVKEGCREVRPLALLESVIGDLAYALRTCVRVRLSRRPQFCHWRWGSGPTPRCSAESTDCCSERFRCSHPETLVRIRSAGRNDMTDGINTMAPTAKTPRARRIRETISYPVYQTLRQRESNVDRHRSRSADWRGQHYCRWGRGVGFRF